MISAAHGVQVTCAASRNVVAEPKKGRPKASRPGEERSAGVSSCTLRTLKCEEEAGFWVGFGDRRRAALAPRAMHDCGSNDDHARTDPRGARFTFRHARGAQGKKRRGGERDRKKTRIDLDPSVLCVLPARGVCPQAGLIRVSDAIGSEVLLRSRSAALRRPYNTATQTKDAEGTLPEEELARRPHRPSREKEEQLQSSKPPPRVVEGGGSSASSCMRPGHSRLIWYREAARARLVGGERDIRRHGAAKHGRTQRGRRETHPGARNITLLRAGARAHAHNL